MFRNGRCCAGGCLSRSAAPQALTGGLAGGGLSFVGGSIREGWATQFAKRRVHVSDIANGVWAIASNTRSCGVGRVCVCVCMMCLNSNIIILPSGLSLVSVHVRVLGYVYGASYSCIDHFTADECKFTAYIVSSGNLC